MCHLQLNLKWFANCHLAPWIKGLWRICTFQIKQRIHLKQNPSLKFSMPQKKLFHRLLPIRERRASVCLSSSSGDFLDNNAMKCVREGDRKTSSVICGSWGKISPQRISQPWKRERREGEREREREREKRTNGTQKADELNWRLCRLLHCFENDYEWAQNKNTTLVARLGVFPFLFWATSSSSSKGENIARTNSSDRKLHYRSEELNSLHRIRLPFCNKPKQGEVVMQRIFTHASLHLSRTSVEKKRRLDFCERET